jgi:outer membrane protein OmpA-like peptidoglycan-associated protein
MKNARALGWMLVALLAWPAQAQFGDLLNSAKDRAMREAADSAYDSAKEGVKGTAKSKGQKPAQAQPQEEPAEEESPPPAKKAVPASAAPAAAAPAAPPPGEVYGNRFDFVPGDKVLVYDDFSDTDVGEYPAKWTIKEGGGNAMEVVQVGNQRFMKSRYQPQGQGDSLHWLRYNVKGDLPKNFTIEFDADVAGQISVVFSNRYGFGGQQAWVNRGFEGNVHTVNAQGALPVKSGVRHVSIAVSGTQLKVYVAGERVVSDPDGVERPISRVGVYFEEPWPDAADHQMFTNFRMAEGGKPAKQMLAGEGRIVTHGILFDTGSDVIKPESGPTLRSILALLQEDPGLRFSIEGHTDNQGGPKMNGPLSERRAAAVKAWLVKQGIDASRLSTKGLGDTKPLDSNATAEGRANNRRVEFVKT